MSVDAQGYLGAKLDKLWDAERCTWHIDFSADTVTDYAWVLTLEWVQEHGTEHGADWVTFAWLFYGATVEEAVGIAIDWCEGLLPFERCWECDGEGAYGYPEDRKVCPDCEGSGLSGRARDLRAK